MNLTLHQKAELDSLVNFFGGSDCILSSYRDDPDHKRLQALGLIEWKHATGMSNTFSKLVATKRGIEVAKRFKRDWSQVWADLHPSEPEE